ncbi:GAF domain-containing protein [Nocardia terpenica]|uniref:GAF domain-containing protein n=1 Tax=Nocardia terpenica TaxID=455432 RepID=UPI000B20E74B|nr:GAF domain-containing protein [Nocardia terpenica]NQE85938.1 DUF5593 domain-containing protein [Nocardia terpenica]
MLFETMTSAGPSVILEDGHIRQFSRSSRTRIAGCANVASQLDAVLSQVVGSGQPAEIPVRLASGLWLRIVAVPVIGPAAQVYAVQLWVGRADAEVPPRLPIGVLSLDPRTGIAQGCEISQQTDNPEVTGKSVLPYLLGQLDGCADRAGLLELMSAPAGQQWIGSATSVGPERRHLCVAARSCPSPEGPLVRVIVCDITEIEPPTPRALDIGVWRTMPVSPGHGAGLVDLRSGLVHEWIVPGPPPLDRWITEVPQTHPEDTAKLQRCRDALIGGAVTEQCLFRMRFSDTESWIRVRASWTAVPCDGAPQAVLDVTRTSLGNS